MRSVDITGVKRSSFEKLVITRYEGHTANQTFVLVELVKIFAPP